MNVIVLGASRGIGRAVARRLAQRGDRLFLLGRDLADLALCANDLAIRANQPSEIGMAACDMTVPDQRFRDRRREPAVQQQTHGAAW